MLRSLAYLARPYIWRELPGWGKLYSALRIGGVDNTNAVWRDAPTKTVRGKSHGYLVQTDLGDDVDRSVYFLGRYYDLEIQLAAQAILRPGDCCIDIGSNVGNFALCAARQVSDLGKVLAFEPNPVCIQRLTWLKENNDIPQLTIYPVGVGDKSETLVLALMGGGSILGSYTIDSDDHQGGGVEYETQVVRGDAFLSEKVSACRLIKIDVEGFECSTLAGLRETASRLRPVFIVEMDQKNLGRAGKSCTDVVEYFEGLDYRGYILGLEMQMSRKPSLTLAQLDTKRDWDDFFADVVWLPHEFDVDERLRSAII